MIDRRSFIKSFGFGLAAVTVAPVVVLKTVVKPSAPPIVIHADVIDSFYHLVGDSMKKYWEFQHELMKHTPLDTIIDEIKEQNPGINLDIEWKTEYYEQK